MPATLPAAHAHRRQTTGHVAGTEAAHLNLIDPQHPIRILVIDDEASYLRLMTLFLSRYGYTVLTASRGDEALPFASQADVALVDMIMPGLSGLETIPLLRERNPELKVIASSGCAERDFRRDLDRVGVEHFLGKPLAIESLMDRIEHLMGCSAA